MGEIERCIYCGGAGEAGCNGFRDHDDGPAHDGCLIGELRSRIVELEAREPPSYPLPMCTIHHDLLIGGKCVYCQSKGIAALVDRVSALERCKNRLKRAVVRMDSMRMENRWHSRYRGASRALANVIRENTEKANRIEELEAWARGVIEYETDEVVKDEFAYDRMLEVMKDAARQALEASDD